MATKFYLRSSTATGVVPNAKQSTDTVPDDWATTYATYAAPADMLTTAGASTVATEGTAAADPNQRYEHYGTWISPPLAAQSIPAFSTVTIALSMKETRAKQNVFPRVYIYTWKPDDTFGSSIRSLITSTTEVDLAYSLVTYFSLATISTADLVDGERLVIEIEGDCDPTETVSAVHGIQFNGADGGTGGSYVSFSPNFTFFTGTALGSQVDSTTTTTFNLSQRHKVGSQVDSVTTTTINAGQRHKIGSQADSVTTATFNAGLICKLSSTVDALTTVTDELSKLVSVSLEINSLTTVLNNLTICNQLESQINALTSVLTTLSHIQSLQIQIDALSETIIYLNNLISFGAQVDSLTTSIFNASMRAYLQVQVNALTTVTDELSKLISILTEINSLTTTTFDLKLITSLESTINAITTILANLNKYTSCSIQIDALTTITDNLTAIFSLSESEINATSGVTASLGINQPLSIIINAKSCKNLLSWDAAKGTDLKNDTSSFAAYNTAALSSSTTQYWECDRSLKIVTGNIAPHEGFITSNYILAPKKTVFSTYIKGDAGGEDLQIFISTYDSSYDSLGIISQSCGAITTSWARKTLALTLDDDVVYIKVGIYTNLKAASTFYVDGLQVENNTGATTFEGGIASLSIKQFIQSEIQSVSDVIFGLTQTIGGNFVESEINAISGVTSDLGVKHSISIQIDALTTITDILTTLISVSSQIDALTATTIDLKTLKTLESTIDAVTSVLATLSHIQSLQVQIDALTTIIDTLATAITLSTQIDAITESSHTLILDQALEWICAAISSIPDIELSMATEMECEINAISSLPDIELTSVATTLILTAIQHETHIDLTWVTV